jgi:hypothetical protein
LFVGIAYSLTSSPICWPAGDSAKSTNFFADSRLRVPLMIAVEPIS